MTSWPFLGLICGKPAFDTCTFAPAPASSFKARKRAKDLSDSQQPMKRPPWAAFLKNKGIDALSHKQLQGACKKARLNAGGAAAALRARLQEFVELESPPAWYVESIKAAESKKKAQAESRKLAQEADVSVHDLLEWKENEMAVGQKLVHISVERLTGGSSVRLLTAQPKGCVKQSTT